MSNSDLPYFWDTETCGFHGMPVTLQYALGNDDPTVLDLWHEPCGKSFEIIEKMLYHPAGNVLFNATFDLFHIIKFYTTAKRITERVDEDIYPIDWIDQFGEQEALARFAPYTLKWHGLCDLMLVAMQGPYQSMMDRKDIRIKRIPTALAYQVADYLEDNVPLADSLFARRKKKDRKWKVDIDEDEPDFSDLYVKFAPSRGLKVIAQDAGMKVDTIFDDLFLDDKPVEYGYAPYAKAGVLDSRMKFTPDFFVEPVGRDNWRGTWPDRIANHAAFWKYDKRARQYAYDDPILTRGVWEFLGKPPMNDHNSILTNVVASSRWKGYKIDRKHITPLRTDAIKRARLAPTAPARVKSYVYDQADLDEIQKAYLEDQGYSTKNTVLEAVSKWSGPIGKRAQEVREARSAEKEVELYNKLLHADRFHASFKVIGTLSDRMAGADGLNPQGIKAVKEVRQAFPLADEGFRLSGGDFDAFEVSIAAAVYDDPSLTDALVNGVECPSCFGLDDNCPDCEGSGVLKVKMHALFAQALFPEMTLAEINATKDTENDRYKDGKQGFFATIYGGNEKTLEDRLGVDEETAKEAFVRFGKMFPGVKRFQDSITADYCSMTQPAGIGSRVVWKDPKEYVESIFGFKRFFTLENTITKALFKLAEDPPSEWKKFKIKVKRRDRVQTGCGATMSALFAAAFNVQGKCLRAASNHLIQSPGADITKDLQVRLWVLQPVGVCEWHVQPFNVHDEVNAVSNPRLVTEEQLNEITKANVNHYKKDIPLLILEWHNDMKSWAEKK